MKTSAIALQHGAPASGQRAQVEVARTHPVLELQRAAGNAAVGTLIQRCANGRPCAACAAAAAEDERHVPSRRPVRVQRRLAVSQSEDPAEREAERVAEHVMRMGTPVVQRKCASCEDEERELHRKPRAASAANRAVARNDGAIPSVVHEALGAGRGRPLDSGTRGFFEPRFGTDFRRVRVRSDGQAAAAAAAVNARAFTVGESIYFGTGEYRPHSDEGRRLLAHELTHVVQQSAASVAGSGSPLAGRAVLQRLGANPGCTAAERAAIHQAIFDARGWLNVATPKVEASPLAADTVAALRRNFGPTYGDPADAPLIAGRLRRAYREISTIPFACQGAADAVCGLATTPGGYAGVPGASAAGTHAAVICTNTTLTPGRSSVYQAGVVLHESFHAAFTGFTAAVDRYSGWHGASGSTPGYPGAGTDPLLNADSYTSLVMDLS